MPGFSFTMHQIQFWLELHSRVQTLLGSIQRSHRPLAEFRGSEKEWKGKEKKGREGKEEVVWKRGGGRGKWKFVGPSFIFPACALAIITQRFFLELLASLQLSLAVMLSSNVNP